MIRVENLRVKDRRGNGVDKRGGKGGVGGGRGGSSRVEWSGGDQRWE